MATQGLVTVMKDGKVICKIVAGDNGYFAPQLAESIRQSWPLLAGEIYNVARRVGFGCERCLVVMSETKVVRRFDEQLHRRYRRTFDQPAFNPRWEHGTVDDDCYALVEL